MFEPSSPFSPALRSWGVPAPDPIEGHTLTLYRCFYEGREYVAILQPESPRSTAAALADRTGTIVQYRVVPDGEWRTALPKPTRQGRAWDPEVEAHSETYWHVLVTDRAIAS